MDQLQAVQVFNFQDNQEIRTVIQNGEPWFAAPDVCKILDIADVTSAVNRLDDDERGWYSMRTLGGNQTMNCVNESGLYHLIFTSRKAEAQTFRKWVTSEVLPAIRKTGSYGVALPDLDAMKQSIDQLSASLRDARRELKRLTAPQKRTPKETRRIAAVKDILLQFLAKEEEATVRFIVQFGPPALRKIKTEGIRGALNELEESGIVARKHEGKKVYYLVCQTLESEM